MDLLDIAIAKQLAGGGGGSGTDNYNDLSNLPKINDTTLSGNKTSANLGLQSEINSDSKLASDLVDDTNQDNKFVTSAEKTTWNGKQNAIDADHKINADYVDDSTSTNKFVTASDKETWNAKQNAIDNSHKLSSDLVDDANHTNKFVTSTEKNTWNGKQNAIDSEHKLSSSLVSFTTAEAAALASGIDSTKVGQISTNQSNILYGIKTGAKNQLKLTGTVYNPNALYVYWDYENGTVRVTGSNLTTDTVFINLGTWTAPEDDTYRIYANSEACTANIRVYDNGTWGTYTAEYSNEATWTKGTTRTLYLRIAKNVVVGDITVTPMICPKSIFDADPTFAPFALPNYDLTRLEAEDRAELVELVDSGAKNKFDIFGWRSTADFKNGNVVTKTTGSGSSEKTMTFTLNNDGSITIQGATADSQATLIFACGNFSEFSGLELTGGYNSHVFLKLEQAGSPYTPYALSDSQTTSMKIVTIPNNVQVNFFLRIDANQTISSAITIKPMICTKAAFGVSNKFVPYRPNYDLVATRSGIISKLQAIGTDWTLIDLTFTGTAAYVYTLSAVVNASGNFPTGIAISTSNNASDFLSDRNLICKNDESPRTTRMMSCSALDIPYATTTYYVWAKSLTSSTNYVVLTYYREGR